jgi:uncharacterized protein (DUF1778 family)
VPRKPPVRNQKTQLNIRLTESELERLEAAASHLVAGIPGAKVAVSRWMVEVALAEADKILATKKST